jgi:uncharacterized membrane protein
MKTIFVCLFSIALLLSACNKDDEKPMVEEFACGTEVSLSGDIMPIINTDCAQSRCHLDAIEPLLNSRQDVIDHAEAIRSQVVAGTMPPVQPITEEEIELIDCWVSDGAENN